MKVVLILDFDGVITNLGMPTDTVQAVVPKGGSYAVNRLFSKLRGGACGRVLDLLRTTVEFRASIRAIPNRGVLETLAKFSGPVYVASMQSEGVILFFLKRNSMLRYFEAILGRDGFSSKAEQIAWIKKREESGVFVFVDDSAGNLGECGKIGVVPVLFDGRGRKSLYEAVSGALLKASSQKG